MNHAGNHTGAHVPRTPAEWEHQSGVLLAWPENGGAWGPDRAVLLDNCFTRITREIARREAALITVQSHDHRKSVSDQLARAGVPDSRIRLHVIPSDDVWSRDHGPITVLKTGSEPCLLDFRFNGWGGKYPAGNDDSVNARLAARGTFGSTAMHRLELVLEGGSIESDGAGTILANERCVLDTQRNPEMNRTRMESELRQQLGAERVLWLAGQGLAGDDTDGHIDTLARFSDTRSIVYQGCDDPADEHFEPLRIMAGELAALRTAKNQPFRLRALPLPPPIHDQTGRRLPAGYANFLLLNGSVLMPGYHCNTDTQAADILAACFPKRKVVTIDCRVLLEQSGSLHCLAMQFPESVPLPKLDS